MTDELLSLHLLVVSASAPLHQSMQQGAAALSIPIEVVEANNAESARQMLARRIDLAFIDSALGRDACATIVRAGRAAARPPFLVLLADAQTAHVSDGDGVA